uniref:G-protein coupled receptors family 1 profile domain-containing protein n=1 Tax=Esox lucius TaxID=8010 RepID=A0AAY5KM04_ESOLU
MDSESNCTKRTTVSFGNAFMSAGMFSAGVLGNFIALVLLEMRRRRQSPSLFQVLVTALVTTDLVGTFSVSPLVLTSYTQNKALVAMRENNAVCAYFGFSMTFLSLATLAIVCAMALERYLSFGHPYFHEQHLRKRCGYITIAIIYLLCLFFCLGPFMGFGEYIQYCPGTWCFFDINPKITKNKVYVYIYASLALMMILTTVICNLCVVYHLILMYRRRKVHRVGATRRIRFYQRSLSMAEEVEHLLLLIFITGAFVTCSFPLVQDNAPCCTARSIKVWMEDHQIKTLPAQSPDLNPIENLWSRGRWMVRSHQTKSSYLHFCARSGIKSPNCNETDWWRARRMKAVIKNLGYSTKYTFF